LDPMLPFIQSIRSFLRSLELLPFAFVPARPDADDLLVVTGADSSHFRSLLQFLTSLREHEPEVRCVAWDLALAPEERAELVERFPDVEVRTFDYAQYPSWFWIKVDAGCYAWKPIIVSDMIREHDGLVLWMDAGDKLTAPLDRIRKIIRGRGFYSPRSPGRIRDWTHPGTLRRLSVPARILDRINLASGLVGIDTRHPKARILAEAWRAGALDRETIAPAGSDGSNHRQDQAVLSVLAHMLDLVRWTPRAYYDVLVQQDCDETHARIIGRG